MGSELPDHDVQAIQRPHRRLLTYYALQSLLLGPLFPLLLVPRWLRYRTLRYEFGDDGIAVRWGVLFRNEIHLTYARIQDIHLHSNMVERWLGLARVLIQTASGSAKAEMIIEGVPRFEALRDFVYARMRGASDPQPRPDGREATDVPNDLAATLDAVAHELREIRAVLSRRAGDGT